MLYKVTKTDLTSVGLKRVKPIQYILGEWVYPESSKGGLYIAKLPSFVKWMVDYMKEKYGEDTRVFECEIGNILNESRRIIETDQVRLLREVEP